APLGAHGVAQVAAHPSRHLHAIPALSLCLRLLQPLVQRSLLFSIQQRCSTRILMTLIAYGSRPLRVVAPDQLANPIQAVPCHRPHFCRTLPATQQPQNLPLTAGYPILGCSVSRFQFLGAQLLCEFYISWHSMIIHPLLVSDVGSLPG